MEGLGWGGVGGEGRAPLHSLHCGTLALHATPVLGVQPASCLGRRPPLLKACLVPCVGEEGCVRQVGHRTPRPSPLSQ